MAANRSRAPRRTARRARCLRDLRTDHDVSRLANFALYALQHRGQEWAGIAAADHGGRSSPAEARPGQPGLQGERPRDAGWRACDRTRQVLDDRLQPLGQLPAGPAVGGLGCQPAGGGAGPQRQLDQRGRAARRADGEGVTFRSTSDSEIIAAAIATHDAARIEDAVAEVLPRLKGAFSTVVMTRDRVIGFRDPHGLRRSCSAWCPRSRPASCCATALRASRAPSTSSARSSCETCAGGCLAGPDGLESIQVVDGARQAFCVFEYISFARPDSRMNGNVLQVARGRMGEIRAGSAGRRRPRDPGAGLRQPGGPRLRAGERTSQDDGS